MYRIANTDASGIVPVFTRFDKLLQKGASLLKGKASPNNRRIRSVRVSIALLSRFFTLCSSHHDTVRDYIFDSTVSVLTQSLRGFLPCLRLFACNPTFIPQILWLLPALHRRHPMDERDFDAIQNVVATWDFN